MNVVDQLLEQRDAVLFGTWVTRIPKRGTDEACLMETGFRSLVEFNREAGELITEVCRQLNPQWAAPKGFWAWDWVDQHKPTREEALEVLDEAIRRAKASADIQQTESGGS